MVAAIIKSLELEEMRDVHSAIGVQGITVTEVKGFGRQNGNAELYRGAEYVVGFAQIKVEAAIKNDLPDHVLEAIGKSVGTGKVGDGKIFAHGLEQVIRTLLANPAQKRCKVIAMVQCLLTASRRRLTICFSGGLSKSKRHLQIRVSSFLRRPLSHCR